MLITTKWFLVVGLAAACAAGCGPKVSGFQSNYTPVTRHSLVTGVSIEYAGTHEEAYDAILKTVVLHWTVTLKDRHAGVIQTGYQYSSAGGAYRLRHSILIEDGLVSIRPRPELNGREISDTTNGSVFGEMTENTAALVLLIREALPEGKTVAGSVQRATTTPEATPKATPTPVPKTIVIETARAGKQRLSVGQVIEVTMTTGAKHRGTVADASPTQILLRADELVSLDVREIAYFTIGSK